MDLEIKTKRLILRSWREEDLEPFARMNADPRVMEYFPSILTPEESIQMAKRMKGKIEERGWGWFVVSLISTSEFIGFIGLNTVEKETFPAAHFTPAIEIGWRIAFDHWGQGYATEGAMACLKLAFETLNLKEIVAFTATQNVRSRAVMEKIGMHTTPKDDFDHPRVPKGDRLSHLVLYRIKSEEWHKRN